MGSNSLRLQRNDSSKQQRVASAAMERGTFGSRKGRARAFSCGEEKKVIGLGTSIEYCQYPYLTTNAPQSEQLPLPFSDFCERGPHLLQTNSATYPMPT
jgi:hypothetical protein